jgi:hypothetical protein
VLEALVRKCHFDKAIILAWYILFCLIINTVYCQ